MLEISSSSHCLKITRAQNPGSAANLRHKQKQQEQKRLKKIQVQADAQHQLVTHQVASASYQPQPNQLAEVQRNVVGTDRCTPAPSTSHLVSSRLGPLVNLVPTSDEDCFSLATSHRLLQVGDCTQSEATESVAPAVEKPTLNDDQQAVKKAPTIHSSTPLPVIATPVGIEETEYELQVVADDNDNFVTLSPPRTRPKSVVVVPAGSRLAKRADVTPGTSASRHRPFKRRRYDPPISGKH